MGNSESKKTETNITRQSADNLRLIKPPKQFMSEGEFFNTWPTWKRDFVEFRKLHKKSFNQTKQWGNMLLNLMGPVGQDIYRTFTFTSVDDKENVETLLYKFTEYYIFGKRKKLPLENVYEYINDLERLMADKNIQNGKELIKKKISAEINESRFTDAARQRDPLFSFSSNFNKLTLMEIAFIWNMYSDVDSAKRCPRCGGIHVASNCPALGKQCVKCKDLNHFQNRCPQNFIHNCNYCGGTHLRKKCPAFNDTCTKCKKLNHFSWKCQQIQILQCHFCNMQHGASRSLCPAKNSICTICGNVGHFPSKCNRKSGTRRKIL